MRVQVVAFATAAEALGSGERDVDLPDGGSLADLRALLERDHPGFVALWPRLAVAVDGRLVAGDVTLAAGAEVALLPPVSGGSPDSEDDGGGGGRVRLVDGPLEPDALVATVAGPSRGAVVVFSGTVRDHHRGRPVDRLDYTAYRSMAEAALGRILGEIESAHRDLRAAVCHRLGEVAVGEASVVIAVASPHRAAAFEAAREVLERLKREVPIWKREHYADGGAAWREEEALTASGPAVAAPSR